MTGAEVKTTLFWFPNTFFLEGGMVHGYDCGILGETAGKWNRTMLFRRKEETGMGNGLTESS